MRSKVLRRHAFGSGKKAPPKPYFLIKLGCGWDFAVGLIKPHLNHNFAELGMSSEFELTDGECH